MDNVRLVKVCWALYDFANSAYVLMVVAFAFPQFLRTVLMPGQAGADLVWGVCLGLSVMSAGVAGPIIGKFIDRHDAHQLVLRLSVAAAILGTGSMCLVQRNQLWVGVVVFVTTNASFNIASFVYDSYLRAMPVRTIDLLSAVAWGIGYLGGILCLLVAMAFHWTSELSSGQIMPFHAIFGLTAAWLAVFSVPLLIVIPRFPSRESPSASLSVRLILADRRILWFLIGYYFLTDATGTLTNFSGVFARETLNLPPDRVAILLLLVQVVGIPATIGSGWVAKRWGAGRVVLMGTIGWIAVAIWLTMASSEAEILGITVLIGLVIGSTYSAARSYLAFLAPHGALGTTFGLNAFSGRISETIAPIIFGAVSTVFSSQRLGVAAMLPFLVVAFLLLRKSIQLPQPAPVVTDGLHGPERH